MTSIIALLKAMPEILAFIQWLSKQITQLELQISVNQAVTQVHNSFAAKDPDELKKLFAGP